MQLRLNDVTVNETPKFQCLKPMQLSHTISVRGDSVNDVLVIPLELDGVASCFPTFKPSQEDFDTCDRYELTYETPDYDPSSKTFQEHESSMMDSMGILKVPGDHHPRRRQVCSLKQDEMEIKLLTMKFSDTSAQLQDMSSVLDDSTLLPLLRQNANDSDDTLSAVSATMRDKGGVDAATLAKNWGIGI